MPDSVQQVGLRVGRNSLFALSGEVLGRLVSAVYQVLLARYLGAVCFGELSFALAFTAILGILADLGLTTYVTREVARRRDDPWPVLSRALAARTVLAIGLGLVGILLARVSARPFQVVELVAILALTQLVQGAAELLAAAHRGRENLLRPAAVGVLCRLGLSICGISAIALSADVLVFALLTTAWTLPAVFLLARGLPVRPPGAFARVRPKDAAAILARAWPIGLGVILWTLSFRIDMVFLGLMKGEGQVGLYAAPFRLVEVLLLLQGPLLAAVFPVLASRDPGEEAFRSVWRGALRLLALLGGPLAVILLLDGPAVVHLLFGSEFAGSARALPWLALAIPLSFASGPLLTLLVARDRERTYARIMGARAALSLGGNLLLVPLYGFAGAAAALALTEIGVLALAIGPGGRAGASPGALWSLTKTYAAAALLAFAWLLLHSSGLAFAPRLALLVLAFPPLAFMCGAVGMRDLRLLLSALGLRR